MASKASYEKQARRSGNIRRMSGQLQSDKKQTTVSSSAKQSSTDHDGSDLKQIADDDGHVRVAVRCRPMSDRERTSQYESIVEFESDKRLVVHDVSDSPGVQLGTHSGERKNYSHVYDFDIVFDDHSSQQDVYEKACKPIIAGVLEGYNGTIFAYGQTGTGKTYTMEGFSSKIAQDKSRVANQTKTIANDKRNNINGRLQGSSRKGSSLANNQDDNAGVIPRSFQQIFQHVSQNPSVQFLIRASYVEIYQEEIRDLLRKDRSMQKLELHERSDIGVYVKDLTSFVCKSISEIERVMRVGNQNRIVGATDMNELSSRSHAIFMITVEQQQLKSKHAHNDPKNSSESVESGGIIETIESRRGTSAPITSNSNKQQQIIRVGKLNLVDLAGSERQRKTNSFGQRQKESIKINLSLSALGNVINSLMKLQQRSNNSATIHTPYRDSKLTRLLQDSLGGNSKTLMIANIGPASYNYDETINTLNYASRARCIRNRPRLNEDPKDTLLRELQQEIDLLRMKLAANKRSSGVGNQNILVQSTNNSDKSTSAPQRKLFVELELCELKQKLSSLEGKLLNGRVSVDQSVLKGLSQKQEDELLRQRSELADQVNREKAIRDELERRVEAELAVRQSYETVQQEVEAKRRSIKQILLKIKAIRDEVDDTQQAFSIELDELEQLHNVLQRELKLKCLIMNNFIPSYHVDQILDKIVYSEQKNICHIESDPTTSQQSLSGQCCFNLVADTHGKSMFEDWQSNYNSIRPRSEFEHISDAIYPSNIRYKYEDLVEPELEKHDPKSSLGRSLGKSMVEGDKLDSVRQQTTPRLQALIYQALNEREPDIVI